MSAPRTVFAQLALVIALVLLGAAALALLLGGVLAVRPGAEQLARALGGFAGIAEAQLRTQPRAQALARLREAGFDLRDGPPDASPQPRRRAPLVRELQRMADAGELGEGRLLRTAADAEGVRLWLKLDAEPAVWVTFPIRDRRAGTRRFSMAMLGGCVVLVWLAAAHFARRLVQPLHRLAAAAPALVNGEAPAAVPIGGPREVRELGVALARSSREVREAAEERALMLAGISHDLRTPLMRLQYALALLPDAGSDPELRAGMERDIAEIDAVLSQFVAYARDGRDENGERLDLADICRHAVAAGEAGWRLSLPGTAPMRGRPMALARAVENLVVNAQRHGAPPFALSLSHADGAWQVEVRDGGDGLPAGFAHRATRPFVHGEGGGSGLGLAIVARVARQHGGELRLLANAPRGLRAVLRVRDA